MEEYKFNGHKINSDWLYSIDKTAKILDCSETTVKRKIRKKQISYIKLSGYKILGKDLISHITKSKVSSN